MLLEGEIKRKTYCITKSQGIVANTKLEKSTLKSCRFPKKLIIAKERLCRHPAFQRCYSLLLLSPYLSPFFRNFSAQGISASFAFEYSLSKSLPHTVILSPFFLSLTQLSPSCSFLQVQRMQGWLPTLQLPPHQLTADVGSWESSQLPSPATPASPKGEETAEGRLVWHSSLAQRYPASDRLFLDPSTAPQRSTVVKCCLQHMCKWDVRLSSIPPLLICAWQGSLESRCALAQEPWGTWWYRKHKAIMWTK